MRNLLINLTFIFILVLGGASDAFSQKSIGVVDFFGLNATFNIGVVDWFNNGNRVAEGETLMLRATISSLENDIIFIEHDEKYTFSDMQIINISQDEISKLTAGYYLLTVKIGDTLIGTEKVLIE